MTLSFIHIKVNLHSSCSLYFWK